jgi:hypothetical protein
VKPARRIGIKFWAARSVQNSALVERPFGANLGYLHAADHDPAVWPWLAARAVDQRAVFDDENIVRGELMVVSKNPFATYYPRLLTLSSD